MAEEAKEEKKEEAPKAQAPAEGSAEKRKKINCLTITEIESELKIVKEKMGGFNSRHAQELLLRKKALSATHANRK